MAAAHAGRLDEARDHLVEGLEHVRRVGFADTGGWCCYGLALVAGTGGDAVRAARLLGTGDALLRAGGGILQPAEAAARAASLAAISETLREEEIEAELELGRRLTLDDAVDEARNVSAPAS
jgi:hypothetical protein